nr:CFF_HP1_G0023190.mRNA.1.CDS.1 [Saccharomyces cerevisiae]
MGGKRRNGLCGSLEKVASFQRLRSSRARDCRVRSTSSLQFSRHHRQLRSRYELSLGMHLRDQLALGVTPSKMPHWTAFPQTGNIFWSRFRRWGCYHWLDLANVEVPLQITRGYRLMLMVAVHKELDSDDVPQTVDLI